MLSSYIGRFAPSPTGALHAGSLVCALASFLDAHAHNGQWLVRIEDIDPPRQPNWALPSILQTLEALEMISDKNIVYQSRRYHLYQRELNRLIEENKAYGCSCSRKTIFDSQQTHLNSLAVYPGTCRNGTHGHPIRAWRLLVNNDPIHFNDRWAGPYTQQVQDEIGDFVLKRADGFWAYQLAVVVDDHEQGVTHIVRGADLLSNTPRQIALQRALGYPTPSYMHIPLVLNQQGRKLSKQSGATAIDLNCIEDELLHAWEHLGFEKFEANSLADFYRQATRLWKARWL